ncbi:hypothetical protein Cfor_10892, partial [Coptotermes formosanus]
MATPQKDDNADLPIQDLRELLESVLREERGTSQDATEENRIPELRHISLHQQVLAGHYL